MDEQIEPTERVTNEAECEEAQQQPSEQPVSINGSFSLGASARQDMDINSSLVFGAAAGRDMMADNGLTFSAAVGRDFSLNDGASLVTVVGKGAQITDGGSAVTFCRELHAQNGSFGLLIARDAQIGEGSKVMVNMSTKQALLFGLAFGGIFAVLNRLFSRR